MFYDILFPLWVYAFVYFSTKTIILQAVFDWQCSFFEVQFRPLFPADGAAIGILWFLDKY